MDPSTTTAHSSSSSSQNDKRNRQDVNPDDDWYDKCVDDSFDISEMRRENEKRCSQFHTIGYRDGLMAGKEASAQEGFNVGFKQSVVHGYKLGLVRGVTSGLSWLPDYVKDKLSGSMDSKSKLHSLHEAVQLISTDNALKMLHNVISLNDSQQLHFSSKSPGIASDLPDDNTSNDQLGRLFQDLEFLLQEIPVIKLHAEPRYQTGGQPSNRKK